MKLLAATVAVLALAGCADKDVWTLQQESALVPGRWDSVALFYGYADDGEGCTEVVNALKDHDSFRNASLRCVPGDVRD